MTIRSDTVSAGGSIVYWQGWSLFDNHREPQRRHRESRRVSVIFSVVLCGPLKPIDDQRSTAAYRKHVALNLLHEFLKSMI